MKEGRVQQYVAPLEVYNNPTNLFCAEFVGNPTINFIDVVCEKDAPAGIRLASEDHFFKFTPLTGRPILKQGQVLVLGLRPEHVSLSQDGSIKSNVYSTLPSGMETIVMVRIKDTLLTSVAFGGLDYEVDSEIGLSLNYDNYILFDKTSGSNIATGSLKMIRKDSASS
jgi:multiple sugar transport system ATP-binding protein